MSFIIYIFFWMFMKIMCFFITSFIVLFLRDIFLLLLVNFQAHRYILWLLLYYYFSYYYVISITLYLILRFWHENLSLVSWKLILLLKRWIFYFYFFFLLLLLYYIIHSFIIIILLSSFRIKDKKKKMNDEIEKSIKFFNYTRLECKLYCFLLFNMLFEFNE